MDIVKPLCSPCCLPRTAIRPSATRLPSCRNSIPRPPRIRPSGAGTPRISGPFVCSTGCWVLLMLFPSACRVGIRPGHQAIRSSATEPCRYAEPRFPRTLGLSDAGTPRISGAVARTSSLFLRPAVSRIRSKGHHFFDLVLFRCPWSSFLLVSVLRRHLNAPLIPLLTPM